MGVPTPPPTPYDEERTPGLEFAESMAALARAVAFYPETNSRVLTLQQATFEQFRGLYGSRPVRMNNELLVLFSRTELSVDGERFDLLPGSNLAWLADRLDTCGLAGVSFGGDATPESLMAFCRQVLDAYRRSALDADFEETAAVELPGVRPLLRRFDGQFDGPQGGGGELRAHAGTRATEQALSVEDEIASRLLRDPRVLARIERLASKVAEEDVSTQRVPAIELLGRIARTLPLEAAGNGELAVNCTLDVLDFVEKERATPGAKHDSLGRALLAAGLRLFSRNLDGVSLSRKRADANAQRRVVLSAASRGHASDDVITDDLDTLLEELLTLPPASSSDLRLLRAEDPVEQIGVYLHYLVTLESDMEIELAMNAVAPIANAAGAEERKVIGRYIENLRPDASTPASDIYRRRLLDFLHAFGLTRLLAEYGAFTSELAIALFPEDFGLYVESLDLRNAREHSELALVLDTLGPERISQAAPQLVRDARILDPVRARRILARAHPAMSPIARIVLGRGENSLKAVVAAFVRALEPGGEESCLLSLLDDEDLPRDYLADLLEPPSTPLGRTRMHERIADTLADFIEATDKLPSRHARRLAAIRQLALFQSAKATALLQRLAHGRRLLFLPLESNEVRLAARASLTCHV